MNLTQEQVEEVAGQFNVIFYIIFGVLVLMFVLSNVIYYVNQKKKKATLEAEDSEPSEEPMEDSEVKIEKELIDTSTTELNEEEWELFFHPPFFFESYMESFLCWLNELTIVSNLWLFVIAWVVLEK